MSEHAYQNDMNAEQQFEEAREVPATANSEETAPEKGRSRVGPVVLEVLQHSKNALTPQQVHERLPEFSEQQINAAIQNLYKKGAGKLERMRQGRSFAYSAKLEKVRQKRKGRIAKPTELPQDSLAAAEVPLHKTAAPATEQSQGQNQVQIQEQQSLNVMVSMDGRFVITKDGQTINLDADEREQFFNFVRQFLA